MKEKAIVLFYKIDVGLLDLEEYVGNSFLKGTELFKQFHKVVRGSANHRQLREKSKMEELFSEILSALQYRDLIAQKFTHINEIHKKISEKLIGTSEVSPTDEKFNIQLIIKILELSFVQITNIRQEYLAAVTLIINNLQGITKILYTIESAQNEQVINCGKTLADEVCKFKDAVIDSGNFENLFLNVINLINSYSNDHIIQLNSYTAIEPSQLKEIESIYTMETERRILNEMTFGIENNTNTSNPEGKVELF